VISVICDSFGCTPSEALKENPKLIKEVLDFRMATTTKEQFNQDASKMTPDQVSFWAKLNEARDG
jgi:hypothetical protein